MPLEIAVRGTDRRFAVADGATLVVGRSPECDIHLEDAGVSRRHCTLAYDDGAIVVRDLGSANGTFVNGRTSGLMRAATGDAIRVGSSQMLDVCEAGQQPRRGSAVIGDDDPGMQAVVSRRIEPARADWLTATSDASAIDIRLLQAAQRHLSTLHAVSENLAAARDLKALSRAALDAILEVTAAERAAVVLRRPDPETEQAEIAAARWQQESSEPFTVSRTLVADTIERGVSIFANDASRDARFAHGVSVIQQQVRSVMCVPLRTTDEILGALYVDSRSGAGRFTDADLELLAAIGNQAGVALHRIRLLGQVERLLIDTIRAIAATIDAKDGYTHRHSERVAALSRCIAGELGLPPGDQETAELSALLHDVGKIGVPDTILNKPGRLTPDEFEEMKKHPVHGARILANIQSPLVQAVLPGVQYHHERWDGSGYPEGLTGTAIPMLGRLLGIADFLDALSSARSYRAAMPMDDVVKLVESAAGVHFDPEMVVAVVRLHARGELTVRAAEGAPEYGIIRAR